MIGKQFGNDLVIDRKVEQRSYGKLTLYLVECQKCSNKKWVQKSALVNGNIKCRVGICNRQVPDFTNQIFHYWTALEYVKDKKSRGWLWKCKCKCGNVGYVRTHTLQSGQSKSCGCYMKEQLSQRQTLTDYIGPKREIYRNYNRASNKRNYEFLLTEEQFFELIEQPCFYCGIEKSMVFYRQNYRYNGVDRVDNSIGYTINNTVSCCKNCNNSKSTLSQQEWFNWLKQVYTYQKAQGTFND